MSDADRRDDNRFRVGMAGAMLSALFAEPLFLGAAWTGDLRWLAGGLAAGAAAWGCLIFGYRAHRRKTGRMLGHLGRKEGSRE